MSTTRISNALRRPFENVVTGRTSANPRAVYDALADLESHRVWGSGKNGLQSLTAPVGPARVGTEFESTGNDPMGPFEDRSVVTEARPGELFEFVTDARQQPRKGDPVEWTIVHRYEISPTSEGSQVTYTNRVTRMSRTPGALRLINSRALGGLLHKMTRSVVQAGLNNFIAHVENG
ncbi:MAG TPA: SRPBCC family protein [Actinomycetota bacterium]|nr:SRPBCC family protein [Actinomycetota bacterium]